MPPPFPPDGFICLNTCNGYTFNGVTLSEISYSDDQHCDDGGEGADYDVCPYGTDCKDCGPRVSRGEYVCSEITPLPPPSPPSPPEPPSPPPPSPSPDAPYPPFMAPKFWPAYPPSKPPSIPPPGGPPPPSPWPPEPPDCPPLPFYPPFLPPTPPSPPPPPPLPSPPPPSPMFPQQPLDPPAPPPPQRPLSEMVGSTLDCLISGQEHLLLCYDSAEFGALASTGDPCDIDNGQCNDDLQSGHQAAPVTCQRGSDCRDCGVYYWSPDELGPGQGAYRQVPGTGYGASAGGYSSAQCCQMMCRWHDLVGNGCPPCGLPEPPPPPPVPLPPSDNSVNGILSCMPDPVVDPTTGVLRSKYYYCYDDPSESMPGETCTPNNGYCNDNQQGASNGWPVTCNRGFDCSDCGVMKPDYAFWTSGGSSGQLSIIGETSIDGNTGLARLENFDCCTEICDDYDITGLGCPLPCVSRRRRQLQAKPGHSHDEAHRRRLDIRSDAACGRLLDAHGSHYNVGDCFFSFYNLGEHNNPNPSFGSRRVADEAYMCRLLPFAPPPPPTFATSITIETLASANVQSNLIIPVIEGGLADALENQQQSIAVEDVSATGRLLQSIGEPYTYDCCSGCCADTCNSENTVQMVLSLSLVHSTLTQVEADALRAVLRDLMADFRRLVGATVLCSISDSGLMDTTSPAVPPYSPSPPPPSPSRPSPMPISPPAPLLPVESAVDSLLDCLAPGEETLLLCYDSASHGFNNNPCDVNNGVCNDDLQNGGVISDPVTCQRGYDCTDCGAYYWSATDNAYRHVPGTGYGSSTGGYSSLDCCRFLCDHHDGKVGVGCQPCEAPSPPLAPPSPLEPSDTSVGGILNCMPESPAGKSKYYYCYDDPNEGLNGQACTPDNGFCNDNMQSNNPQVCKRGYDCSDCGVYKPDYSYFNSDGASGALDYFPGTQQQSYDGDGRWEGFDCCAELCDDYDLTGIGCAQCPTDTG